MVDGMDNHEQHRKEMNKKIYARLGWEAEPQSFIPSYIEDIKAAWDIVEFVVSQKSSFSLLYENKKWTCGIGPEDGPPGWVFRTDKMAPMAISKTFLKTKVKNQISQTIE